LTANAFFLQILGFQDASRGNTFGILCAMQVTVFLLTCQVKKSLSLTQGILKRILLVGQGWGKLVVRSKKGRRNPSSYGVSGYAYKKFFPKSQC